MTPQPLHEILGELAGLAGRAGRASDVDEKAADVLTFIAEALRSEAAELEKRARRLKGETAQHLADEEQLGKIARRLEAERSDRERFPRKRGPDRERLSPQERHKLERALVDRPGAGRRAIAFAAGASEWKARRFLAERASSQAGEVSEQATQVAGGNPSPRRGSR
jgi:hypothetical protein